MGSSAKRPSSSAKRPSSSAKPKQASNAHTQHTYIAGALGAACVVLLVAMVCVPSGQSAEEAWMISRLNSSTGSRARDDHTKVYDEQQDKNDGESDDSADQETPFGSTEEVNDNPMRELVAQGFASLEKDDFQAASAALAKAVKISPTDGQVQFQLGYSLFELAKEESIKGHEVSPEKVEEAVRAFETAAKHIRPHEGKSQSEASRVDALYNAGLVAAMSDQGQRAYLTLQQARQLDPSNQDVIGVIRDVKAAILASGDELPEAKSAEPRDKFETQLEALKAKDDVECMVDEYGGEWCKRKAPTTPNGVVCTELFEVPELGWGDRVQAIVKQLAVCGFVYIEPGLVSMEWVREAHLHALNAWGDKEFMSNNARPIDNGGRRVDMIMPLDSGPFNSTMFDAFDTRLFELLRVGPTQGGEISMVVVINAMPTSQGKMQEQERFLPKVEWIQKYPEYNRWLRQMDQIWHDDSMPVSREQLFLVVALHDTESGFIGVQPGCFPKEGEGPPGFLQTSLHSQDTTRKGPPCFNSTGYAPHAVKAGTVMIHQARLRHRGFPQVMHDHRFMMSMDIVSNFTTYQQYFNKSWHGMKMGKIHAARRKLFEKQLKMVHA